MLKMKIIKFWSIALLTTVAFAWILPNLMIYGGYLTSITVYKDEIGIYGTIIGIATPLFFTFINNALKKKNNRKFYSDNKPMIIFTDYQKLELGFGVSNLYLYHNKIIQKKVRKNEHDIKMVMHDLGRKYKLSQVGTTLSFELHFTSHSRLENFTVNSLNMYYYLEESEYCMTNHFDIEKPLFDNGQFTHGNMPYNRILKFYPYMNLNNMKPYIKDDYYVIEFDLIPLAFPLKNAPTKECFETVNEYAMRLKKEFEISRHLCIEMNYEIINDIRIKTNANHTLYFKKVVDENYIFMSYTFFLN